MNPAQLDLFPGHTVRTRVRDRVGAWSARRRTLGAQLREAPGSAWRTIRRALQLLEDLVRSGRSARADRGDR